MAVLTDYKKDTKAGLHLHNNIKESQSDYFKRRYLNAGALISLKGKRQSITIEGEVNGSFYFKCGKNKAFRREFFVGDYVEYDSYNLIYTGKIVKISPRTITVDDMGTIIRMNLVKFIMKNWNLDLDKIAEKNRETRNYI